MTKIADFTVASTSGEDFQLSRAVARYVVLYFYPKDDTPGCTIESGDFTRLLPAFAEAETLVLGVSRDDLRSHDAFRAKFSYAHHLLADTSGELCAAFGVIANDNRFARSTFLIDPSTQTILKEWRDIKDVKGHAQEVLDEVQALAT